MNYIYITGTSRGIGKYLATKFLEDNNNFVIGISRNCSLEHKNYQHFKLDLNNLNEVENFKFEKYETPESIILINNSATLGEVKHVGKRTNQDIINSYNINIISPTILINNFVANYQNTNCKRLILNISSGVARYPMASWATYCATKAALDMTSMVVHEEQTEKYSENPIKIFSVAPGIVDTQMQDEIRATKSEDFSKLDKFISYKEKNNLNSPQNVANKLIELILNSERITKICLDLREI